MQKHTPKTDAVISLVINNACKYLQGRKVTVPGGFLGALSDELEIVFPQEQVYDEEAGLVRYKLAGSEALAGLWLDEFLKIAETIPDLHYAIRAGFVKIKRAQLAASFADFNEQDIDAARRRLGLGFDEALGIETIKKTAFTD